MKETPSSIRLEMAGTEIRNLIVGLKYDQCYYVTQGNNALAQKIGEQIESLEKVFFDQIEVIRESKQCEPKKQGAFKFKFGF
jgi:hypothetical protein